jgi:hypothetical protein
MPTITTRTARPTAPAHESAHEPEHESAHKPAPAPGHESAHEPGLERTTRPSALTVRPPAHTPRPSAHSPHVEGPSRLGFFSGISTFVYLLAAVIIGAEMSGLVGLGTMGLYLGTFCIAMFALASAIVLDVVIGLRGGEGVRTAAISGLFLLLPPTAVAFYLVSATAMQ